MTRLRLVLLGAVLGAALLTGVQWMRRALAGPAATVSVAEGERLLRSVIRRVQQSYVDPVNEDVLWAKAAAGLVGELDDPNSSYLAADRARALSDQTRGVYGGVGIQVDVREGRVVVLGVRAGGPADRAGLQPGDRIVEANGRDLATLSGEEARQTMRGDAGSELRLVIQRGKDRIPLTLVRSELHVRAVSRAQRLPEGAGYLLLSTFNDSAAVEVAGTVDSLVRAGATGLVLDLRNNPGGLIAQGVAVADLFLDRGVRIAEMRARAEGASRTWSDTAAQRWPTLPVVVLVNAATASAAEIVAGALQDHDRAAVLGRNSFGKGSAQSVFPLGTAGALKLTTARWFTPSGRSLDRMADSVSDEGIPVRLERPAFRTSGGREVLGGGGIVPDLVAGDSAPPAADRALMLAVGARLPVFRDAVASAAAAWHARAPMPVVDADVPEGARALLWRELQRRDVGVVREEFDGGRGVVDRLLGAELARLAFGLPAVGQRAVLRDVVVRDAAGLLRDSGSPKALLARVTARAAKPAA